MSRSLRVTLIVIAALVVVGLGYVIINISSGGSLFRIEPTPTALKSFPTPPPTEGTGPAVDPTGDDAIATRAIYYLAPGEMGAPCLRHGVEVTVFEVTRMEKVSEFTPMAGNIYMVVDLEIKNVYWNTYEYRFVYFGFTDVSGQSYFPPHPSPDVAPPPTIGVGTLARGESIRGNILLEVPAEVTTGTFLYSIESSAARFWCQFDWEE